MAKKITFDIKHYSFLTFFTFCSIKALKPGSWTYRLGEFADEINEYELEKLEIITHTVFQSRTHTISSFIPLSLSAFLRCILSITLPVTHLSSFSSSICHVMHSMCSNHKISLDPKLMDIAMDGPYGRFVSYSDHKIVVLVAGI